MKGERMEYEARIRELERELEEWRSGRWESERSQNIRHERDEFAAKYQVACEALSNGPSRAAEELLAEILRLRDALHFYADTDTYFGIAMFADPPCGEFVDDFEVLSEQPNGIQDKKPGKRAREALKTASGESIPQIERLNLLLDWEEKGWL